MEKGSNGLSVSHGNAQKISCFFPFLREFHEIGHTPFIQIQIEASAYKIHLQLQTVYPFPELKRILLSP